METLAAKLAAKLAAESYRNAENISVTMRRHGINPTGRDGMLLRRDVATERERLTNAQREAAISPARRRAQQLRIETDRRAAEQPRQTNH